MAVKESGGILFDDLGNCEDVLAILPSVVEAIHEFACEKYTQTALLPGLQDVLQVRLSGVTRVKRDAVVTDLKKDAVLLFPGLEIDLSRFFRISVANDIDTDLQQRQFDDVVVLIGKVQDGEVPFKEGPDLVELGKIAYDF